MDSTAPPLAPGEPRRDDPAGGPHPGGPRVTTAEMKDLGRLRRSSTDRHVAGVAGGLARHLDVDPIIVRVGFVVTAFFGGAGLLLYLAAWLFVPEEDTEEAPIGLDERSRVVALVGIGVLALLAAVGDWAGAYWFPWPIALAAVAVVWILQRQGRSGEARPTTYANPAATGSGDPGPVDYARPRTPNPRKRGPILFWFTLALIALGIGILGVVDLAGVAVTPSAYPALALAITAAMLLLGAFWGRAGGLIAIGLVSAMATGIAAVGNEWSGDTVTRTPTSASQVEDYYSFPGGDMVLDLTEVSDADALEGRAIHVSGGVGRIEVVLPEGIDHYVMAQSGAGKVDLMGRVSEGLGAGMDAGLDDRKGSSDPDTRLDITIELGVGEIVVREEQGAGR